MVDEGEARRVKHEHELGRGCGIVAPPQIYAAGSADGSAEGGNSKTHTFQQTNLARIPRVPAAARRRGPTVSKTGAARRRPGPRGGAAARPADARVGSQKFVCALGQKGAAARPRRGPGAADQDRVTPRATVAIRAAATPRGRGTA